MITKMQERNNNKLIKYFSVFYSHNFVGCFHSKFIIIALVKFIVIFIKSKYSYRYSMMIYEENIKTIVFVTVLHSDFEKRAYATSQSSEKDMLLGLTGISLFNILLCSHYLQLTALYAPQLSSPLCLNFIKSIANQLLGGLFWYYVSELELKLNSSKILSVNCKYICLHNLLFCIESQT